MEIVRKVAAERTGDDETRLEALIRQCFEEQNTKLLSDILDRLAPKPSRVAGPDLKPGEFIDHTGKVVAFRPDERWAEERIAQLQRASRAQLEATQDALGALDVLIARLGSEGAAVDAVTRYARASQAAARTPEIPRSVQGEVVSREVRSDRDLERLRAECEAEAGPDRPIPMRQPDRREYRTSSGVVVTIEADDDPAPPRGGGLLGR